MTKLKSLQAEKDYSITFRQIGEKKPKWMQSWKDAGSVEMYSYDRISSLFWAAFCKQLIKDGKTEAEAFELMQSSDMRHMLDGNEDLIRNCAAKMASKEFGVK